MQELGDITLSINDLPQWTADLIRLGETWNQANAKHARRMAFVSMPCDSPAAGFVALGAVIGDLRDKDATDRSLHRQSLLNSARQYLESCSVCELEACNPERKRCGYVKKSDGKVRSVADPKKIFHFSSRTDFDDELIAVETKGRGRNGPIVRTLVDIHNWYLAEGYPSEVQEENNPLELTLLRELSARNLQPILEENTRSSYSGLCIALRSMGAATTQKMFSAVRFQSAGAVRTLLDLLPVGRWKRGATASRLTVFNPRYQDETDSWRPPRLVIADGTDSCLRVLQNPLFQFCDVIALVNRMDNHERLQELYEEIDFCARAAETVEELPGIGNSAPFGIHGLSLAWRKE